MSSEDDIIAIKLFSDNFQRKAGIIFTTLLPPSGDQA